MKNTTKGFLAGAAGLGLILGGSTFALWTDSAELEKQRVTAGNLEVKVNKANWRDISDDRRDSRRGGHKINLESFRIIPGDTIQGSYPVNVGLQGDNMVAELSLVENGQYIATDELAPGLEISYKVVDSRGKTVATGDHKGATVKLASEDNERQRGLTPVGAEATGRRDFTVVVTAKFDENTEERDLVKTHATLADAELELKQVRTGAPGYDRR